VPSHVRSAGGLLCCPACGAVFEVTDEWDHDHWYPSGTRTLSRLDARALLLRLAEGAGDDAVGEAIRYDERIGELRDALWEGRTERDELERASRTLAAHDLRRKAWNEVSNLLAHARFRVRLGAVHACHDFGEPPRGSFERALVPLLADPVREVAAWAYEALDRRRGGGFYTAALPAFVDTFDDPALRRGTVELVLRHLDTRSSKLSAGIADYGPGDLPVFEAQLVTDLLERLPTLVRHVLSPKPSGARSGLYQHATTGTACERILRALVYQPGDAIARRIWEAWQWTPRGKLCGTFERWLAIERQFEWR
jgi:hypothetical protein